MFKDRILASSNDSNIGRKVRLVVRLSASLRAAVLLARDGRSASQVCPLELMSQALTRLKRIGISGLAFISR